MTFAEAVQDAGSLAYNIAAVEVWVLNYEKTELYCPEGGFWIHPTFAQSHPSEALFQLVLSPSPEPIIPGNGLAGLLWEERRKIRDSTYRHLPDPQEMKQLFENTKTDLDTGGTSDSRRSTRLSAIHTMLYKIYKHVNSNMKWMSLSDICDYLQDDERANLMRESNFRFVSAIPFNFGGHEGIVTYFSHLPRRKCEDEYLLRAADLIGMASALEDPHRLERARKWTLAEAHLRRFRGIVRIARMDQFRTPIA